MRRLWFSLCIAVFISKSFATQELTYITGMKVQAGPRVSYFTFDLTQKTYGRVKYIPNPNRLIIEFAHTAMRFRIENVTLKNSNVLTMNAKKISEQTLQFTFGLKEKVQWKVYFLPTDKKAGERLQLDVISPTTSKEENPATKKTSEQQSNSQPIKNVSSQDVADAYEKITMDINQDNDIKPHFFTVVIDAGHGGKDSGAVGAEGTQEKKVVLAIAKLLAQKINQSANIRAVLTRNGDYFVPLRKRLMLARKGDADVFIAIHADAYFENSSTGASVYALSKRGATTEAARWLAKRDSYPELGDVELDALKDRSILLRSVLIDLAQTSTIRDSLRLGNKLLDALDDMSPLHFKQVQQAQFVVLKSPDIPSVLVETGFISNPTEEKRLQNLEYQQQIADALFQGINKYINTYAIYQQ